MTADRMLEILERNMNTGQQQIVIGDSGRHGIFVRVFGTHACTAADSTLTGALLLAAETVERMEREPEIKT